MGYPTLSGQNFKITFDRRDGSQGKKQVDVYSEDDETVIVVECKSSQNRRRRSLQQSIQETISLQNQFRNTITRHFKSNGKERPKIVWIYATQNIIWSEEDIRRASDGNTNIEIVTENELQYYETFINHIGPAGKYQILGEFLKGQKIPGLGSTRLPAIRGKVGGHTFYNFVTTPRSLQKIAHINHQARNYPTGGHAYQRMISSSRIKAIGRFVEDGGYFPTNLLVNFSKAPQFNLISNKDNTDPDIKFGWITLPQTYRSASIIDGQHRLYGFSNLSGKFLDQKLFVLAFANMDMMKEVRLFIEINHEQKRVPMNLLLSLLPDIRMGDSNPSVALSALSSAVIRSLNNTPSGAFYQRFRAPGVPPSPAQNLTVSEIVKGIRRSGLIGKVVKNSRAEGQLSGATDDDTISRACSVFNAYFDRLSGANPKRWQGGQSEYICTNPGIRAQLDILGEVVKYLESKESREYCEISTREFSNSICTFCEPIFDFVREQDDDAIKVRFSRRFGEAGVTEYRNHLVEILSGTYPDFGGDEHERWMKKKAENEIEGLSRFVLNLARRLTNFVIDTLKSVHGTQPTQSGEPRYWEVGVTSAIKRKAFEAQLQSDVEHRKPKDAYLNIVDLAEIVRKKENWDYFKESFNKPRPDERHGMQQYTKWIIDFNDLRNIVAHPNQYRSISDDDREFIEWLRTDVSPHIPE